MVFFNARPSIALPKTIPCVDSRHAKPWRDIFIQVHRVVPFGSVHAGSLLPFLPDFRGPDQEEHAPAMDDFQGSGTAGSTLGIST